MSNYENIPQELRDRRQWVCSNAKKVPVKPNGQPASVTNENTWSSFNECIEGTSNAGRGRGGQRKKWGVAFIFTRDDPYAVFDFDHVRVAEGEIEPWALAVIDELASYTELSMSGTGFHVIVRATKPEGSYCKAGRVELYDRAKAMTLTGNTLLGFGADEIRDVDLTPLCEKFLSLDAKHESVTSRPRGRTAVSMSSNGGSPSEGDFSKIGCCYTILGRVKDADRLEAEFKKRFPDIYAARNTVKGARAGVNYIRYSIENFIRRVK